MSYLIESIAQKPSLRIVRGDRNVLSIIGNVSALWGARNRQDIVAEYAERVKAADTLSYNQQLFLACEYVDEADGYTAEDVMLLIGKEEFDNDDDEVPVA